MDTCAHVESTKNDKHKPQRAKRRSPSQICASPSSREAKGERGRAQQKKPTTTVSQKDALNELVAAQKVKHASELLLLTDNKGKH